MPSASALDFELSVYVPPVSTAVDFELSPRVFSNFLLGWGLRGKLGHPGDYDPLHVNGIYQMRLTKRGKVYVKMKFYAPTNPRTPAQQANREKFAAACSAWQLLTVEQKAVYHKRARRLSLRGWSLFIKEYYQQN